MIKGSVSVIIPSRNEKYTGKTIKDILSKSFGNIEVIVILDGWWMPSEEIVNDKRVIYIHYSTPRGMRNAINSAVEIAKGDYILKTDSHCMFAEGFDEILVKSCQDQYVVVPRRKRLDPAKWELVEDGRPPIDYEYLDPGDLHGIRWVERGEERKDILIDDIISAQGSCYLIKKDFYKKIGGLDEINYGQFYLEFQELSFKVWTNDGKVIINKNTWYSHWHKTEGRGYSLGNQDREKAVKYMQTWRNKPEWNKVIKQFLPMPGWDKYIWQENQ